MSCHCLVVTDSPISANWGEGASGVGGDFSLFSLLHLKCHLATVVCFWCLVCGACSSFIDTLEVFCCCQGVSVLRVMVRVKFKKVMALTGCYVVVGNECNVICYLKLVFFQLCVCTYTYIITIWLRKYLFYFY